MVNPFLFMLPAMIAAAEEELLAPFRAAGATSPDRAIAVDDAARDAHFASLLRRGILVQASAGRYYLDEAAIARGRQVNRPVLVGAVLGLVMVGLLALLALLLLD